MSAWKMQDSPKRFMIFIAINAKEREISKKQAN